MPAPSNAVLLEKIENLGETLKANQKANQEAHGLILEQTTKTNGRVTRIEDREQAAKEWRDKIDGGMGIVKIVLIPIVLSIVITWIEMFIKK